MTDALHMNGVNSGQRHFGPPRQPNNRILASLSPDDRSLVTPLLVATTLPVNRMLQVYGAPVENLYFLETGLASAVIMAGRAHRIEVGVIGREGATGLSLITGALKSPYDVIVQSAGVGWRLSRAHLQQVTQSSRSLQEKLMLAGHIQFVQMASTIVANGKNTITQRLARWLLMAHDRVDGNTLFLTHDVLASMLGVRRPGVSTALHSLEIAGLVAAKRGEIEIHNREGLKLAASGSYGAAEEALEQYFPSPTAAALGPVSGNGRVPGEHSFRDELSSSASIAR